MPSVDDLIEGTNLYGELMLSGVPVADQFPGARIQVLFGDFHAFAERGRGRLIQDAHPATGILRPTNGLL